MNNLFKSRKVCREDIEYYCMALAYARMGVWINGVKTIGCYQVLRGF